MQRDLFWFSEVPWEKESQCRSQNIILGHFWYSFSIAQEFLLSPARIGPQSTGSDPPQSSTSEEKTMIHLWEPYLAMNAQLWELDTTQTNEEGGRINCKSLHFLAEKGTCSRTLSSAPTMLERPPKFDWGIAPGKDWFPIELRILETHNLPLLSRSVFDLQVKLFAFTAHQCPLRQSYAKQPACCSIPALFQHLVNTWTELCINKAIFDTRQVLAGQERMPNMRNEYQWS